jgi:Zn-dependent peptidase ImmA (M78 family)
MPRDFFFCEPAASHTGPVYYRSLNAASKTARKAAEQRAMWFQELVARLDDLVEFPAVSLPTGPRPDHPTAITSDTIEAAASSLRKHFELHDGPVPNLLATVERHGVFVGNLRIESEALDSFSYWPEGERPFVFLNALKGSAARYRLDTAHELGHLVLHRHFDGALLRQPQIMKEVEHQAFRFATALLLPEESFLDVVDSVNLDYLRMLKPSWGVSVGAMVMRLRDLGVVDQAEGQRLWRSYGMRGWKREEPLDDELEPERPQLLPSAVDAIGGAQALPAVLRGRLALPNHITEELLALNPGAIAGPPITPVVKLRTVQMPDGATTTAEADVLPFRKNGDD